MRTFKALFATVATILMGVPLQAEIYNFSVNSTIDGTGLPDDQTISSSSVSSIGSVTVSLDITGTYNGDLYGYLQHHDSVNNTDSNVAILLNRIGRTALLTDGFADAGMHITLSDAAPGLDVHQQTSGGGLLTGTFKPDARDFNPATVVTGDARTTLLNTTFQNMDANGDWTLFLVNFGGQGTSTLNGWSLDVELSGVPEPTNIAMAVFAFLLVGVKGTAWVMDRRTMRRAAY